MTLGTLQGYAKAMAHGKAPFYASDLGLRGGTIAAMAGYGYIRKTGNTKSFMINLYDDVYKKVQVYEWEFVDTTNNYVKEWRMRLIEKEYIKAKEFIEAVDALKAQGLW